MKYKKKRLWLRAVLFVFKLTYQLVYRILYAIAESIQWLKFGSQEMMYKAESSESLSEIVNQNKILIELLKKEKAPN